MLVDSFVLPRIQIRRHRPLQITTERTIEVDDGVVMQLLVELPPTRAQKPPILFLHGSFHGAWCWAEHYIEFFTALGYPCVAPNWRGTGGSPVKGRKVPIADHVHDLTLLLDRHMLELTQSDLPPVVVAHSFGGLAVMKYLEQQLLDREEALQIAGIACFCVVPPSGNGPMTMRYLKSSLKTSWRITRGLAFKACLKDAALARTLFFDESIPESKVEEYMSYFARDSKATIDLMDLARQLPSQRTDTDGCFEGHQRLPPILCAGATHDYIVDCEGVRETARYFGTEAVWVDSPHDVMLGAQWTQGAHVLLEWIQAQVEPELRS